MKVIETLEKRNIYRIHFFRKAINLESTKPLKAVLRLDCPYTPSDVAKGLFLWFDREPNQLLTAINDLGHVSIFKAAQIEHFDLKPYDYLDRGSEDKEKQLFLNSKDKSRLIQYIKE